MEENKTTNTAESSAETKFCKECGQKIAKKAVICPHCGCQIENIGETASANPQIIINNSNQNSNQNNNVNASPVLSGRARNKWVAILLLIFLGFVGGHKFYEGKIGMGILYICTFGLCSIGCIVDFFALLVKPNPYYV